MFSKMRSPGDYYREKQALIAKIDALHVMMFVDHIPFDTAQWMALEALAGNPLVKDSWELASKVKDMTRVQTAGKLLTRASDGLAGPYGRR